MEYIKVEKDKWERISHLVDMLGWDIDRMSTSGREIYGELTKLLWGDK